MASTATTTAVLTTPPPPPPPSAIPLSSAHRPGCNLHLLPRRPTPHRILRLGAAQETKEPETAEEATKKYGLEFGLWKIFSSKKAERGKEKSRTEQAKELLAKYGGAYLATSITLSLISFSLCYLLVSAGVDVPALLQKVGIVVDETGGKVGTFALAYAAHKAASPIRFPPTVGLTPIVAGWIGKKQQQEEEEEGGGDGN